MISASSHPTLVSDQLAGIDVATRIEDLDFSRVVLDVHQMELGTLDLKDSQWNFEDNFSRVQKEDRCIGRDPPQKQTPNAHEQANHVSDLLVLRQ